jgi:ribosomal protein L29
MEKEELVNRIDTLEKWISKLRVELVHENMLDGWSIKKYRKDLLRAAKELTDLESLLEKENEDLSEL